MIPGCCAPEDMVNRIRSFRFSVQHQGAAEANFFKFFGRNSMLCDVLNPIFRPNDFMYHILFTIMLLSPPAKLLHAALFAIDRAGGLLHVRQGKRAKDRKVILPPLTL